MTTIIGTIYNDTIIGTSGSDLIYALGGSDYINGGAGGDVMYGDRYLQNGYLYLYGVAGNDTFIVDSIYDKVYEYSGEGVDTVRSYIYSYTLPTYVENLYLYGTAYAGYGTNYNNTIVGNNYNNALYGLGGNDYLYGYAGNDYLNGGTGNDVMYGGTGNDTFVVDSIYDKVYDYSGQGVDTVQSYVSYTLPTYVENLTLYGSAYGGYGTDYNNTIVGNSYSNALYGYGGSDYLYGYGGSDYLYGGTGNDSLSGGDGNDTLQGSSSTYGEYDTLTGGNGTDYFVVGDSVGNFYQSSGYATITDYNGADDYIQVEGVASDFYLDKSYYGYGSSSYYDTLLYTTGGDLLAVIEDTTNVYLTSYYFKFV